MSARVGIGYDVHTLTNDRPLILGGVVIPHAPGLAGHSDADALIHAIVDALLGAAALGDIGQHFPSSDPRWQDAPSTVFLTYTVDLLAKNGWRVGNVDATIILQRPRLAEHIPAMRTHLATHLRIPMASVSVKATTTDSLGFTGRGEGIACMAIALLAPR
jgi:2-C-methyl-D-erythritol 2,4-cyclodiphosphate synthase